MVDAIERLAERLRVAPRGKGPTGFPFEPAPPTTPQIVHEAERDLGFHLPPLLRRAYLEVANGGFGPGYGVMGVQGGFVDDLHQNVVDLYLVWRQTDKEDPAWVWPFGLLPFCHWGCAVYSVVNCMADGNPVSFVDPGVKEIGAPMDSILLPHKGSLEQWLADWLDGKDLWAEVWS